VAFGLAAVPAILTIVMVHMGSQVATSTKSSLQQMGVLFIWMGNIIVFLLTAGIYARMMRR